MTEEGESSKVGGVTGPTQTIAPTLFSGSASFVGYAPTVWLTANFAPRWFEDAVRESQHSGADARRREILFAVAAAESYLFEWVRDIVLKGDFPRVNDFFPPGNATPIKDKWKEVPKTLASKKLIAGVQDLSGRTWAKFDKLVDFRNGLMHAAASRPLTSGLPPESQPVPSPADLQDLRQGWGVRAIFNLITELNAAAGTSPPDWLDSPLDAKGKSA